ncbi:MAG: hypothetical protein IKA10_01675 [Oscillospiraceae bacterium]|nr:hypothetical protein [Oscillospiraceae bacterium]
MVNKGNNNNKKIRNTEKYAFILLVSGYISGLCIGAFFVFSNNANAAFTNSVVNHNDLYVLTVFIIALILKYSGILSGVMCTLPVFLGICNSAYYCNYIINNKNKILYTAILDMLKDTAICILLILYIIIIILQISSKKYILKKDLKYLAVYLSGASIIYIFEHLLKKFIV